MNCAVISGRVAVSATGNGGPGAWRGEAREGLLEALREGLGLIGSQEGCSAGSCGACNVILDGRVVDSCCVLGVAVGGSGIPTVEGIGSAEGLTPLQECFLE